MATTEERISQLENRVGGLITLPDHASTEARAITALVLELRALRLMLREEREEIREDEIDRLRAEVERLTKAAKDRGGDRGATLAPCTGAPWVDDRADADPKPPRGSDALEQVLRQISDPSYVGNYDDAAVVEIYRKWAGAALRQHKEPVEENEYDWSDIEQLERETGWC